MKAILILYIVNTILFLFPMWKQLQIVYFSPEDDPLFRGKLMYFIFNIAILTAMWLGYFYVREAAWFFFLIAIIIAYLTYHKKPKQ